MSRNTKDIKGMMKKKKQEEANTHVMHQRPPASNLHPKTRKPYTHTHTHSNKDSLTHQDDDDGALPLDLLL